ncbi:MAG: Eco29kI family restriction endonuclease, partial [Nitrososphaera sp.]|nr:Eco29kI family restriction endonuclease [Nitrososphaera sp.]
MTVRRSGKSQIAAQPLDPGLHTFRSPKFESVVEEAFEFFSHTPVHPLPPATRFFAGGVYALYYVGDFDLYQQVAERNRREYCQPIYVGKAVPPGWRTARTANKAEATSLYSRLREHARSVSFGANLAPSDFWTRFMIL